MANRTLRVLLKKIYTDGSIDTIYLKSRASDVFLDGSSTDTLASIVTKVNGIQEGATAVSSNATNGYISINGTATQVYAHPNSGVTAGTYTSVTVNAAGHVTAGTNPGFLTSGSKVTFTVASTKANIASNSDTIAVMLGKLSKWYSSFGSLAWLSSVGSSNLDSTLATQYAQRVVTGTANQTASVTTSTEITAAGYVADARAIKTLQDQITTINSNAIKSITRSGVTFTATKLDGTSSTFTQQDTNTTYAAYVGATTEASGTAGLVPAATTWSRLRFLRGDGTWNLPNNYTGATASASGTAGLVPAATSGNQTKFLRADATWQTPTNTTYDVYQGATTAASGVRGLVPAATTWSRLGYLRGDGTWTLPSNSITQEEEGYALDARIGKFLNDKFSDLIRTGSLEYKITSGAISAENFTQLSKAFTPPTGYFVLFVNATTAGWVGAITSNSWYDADANKFYVSVSNVQNTAINPTTSKPLWIYFLYILKKSGV